MEDDDDEEEPAFPYSKYYSNETIDYLKKMGYFDSITKYGKTFKKFQFPPPNKKEKKPFILL